MRKKDKKGFTMIELLAVITLLGILTIIAIPSVRTLIEKGKKNYYATQRNQVELAAKEYLKDNPKLLPGEIGGTTEVNLQDLIDHKYISRVKDQDKADCDTSATKVKVTRTAKRKYKYEVILNCPNYKDEEKTNNKDGRIEFTVQNLNVKNNQSTITDFKVKITIKGKKTNGQDAAIKYYKYRILSGNAVLEEKEYEVLTSTVEKTVNLTEYVKRSDVTTLTIELTAVTVDNHKEVYKQSVSAIDTTAPLCPGAYEGTTTETRDGNIYLKDKDGNILIKTRAGWSQDPQTVTVYCYDKDNYGSKTKCKNAQYTKTFRNDKDITTGFIMEDMMSNKSETCTIPNNMVKIDNTPPTIELRMKALSYDAPEPADIAPHNNSNPIYNEDWFSGKIFTKMYASDNPPAGSGYSGKPTSGVAHYYVTTTGKDKPNENHTEKQSKMLLGEGTSTIKYEVCDEAGNCTTSRDYTIKIDRTAPEITMSSWKYTTDTKPSSHSGLDPYTNDTWFKGRIFTDVVQADKNGVDGSNDASGIKTTKYKITGKGASSGTGTSKEVTAEGTSQIKYNVCDNAGNCRDSNSMTVKLDRTAPTTSVTMYKVNGTTKPSSTSGLSTYSNNTWFSGSVYVVARSQEGADTSGVAEIKYTTTGKTGAASNVSGGRTSAGEVKDFSVNNFITQEGTSTINYNACDMVGNCADSTGGAKTIKLDRTAPQITMSAWKYTSTTKPTSHDGLESYTSGTWLSGRVYTDVVQSDPNGTDGTNDASGIKTTKVDVTGKGASLIPQTGTSAAVTAEGTSQIRYNVCDNANNCRDSNEVEVKLDRTAPTTTVTMYKVNGTTKPTSTSGLSTYTNNTWYSGSTYVVATSKEGNDTSGVKTITYTTSGKTGTANNAAGASTSTGQTESLSANNFITAEGTSTIKYNACDMVGNCADNSVGARTIKLDRTAPSCTSAYTAPTDYNGGWTNQNVKIQGTCSELGDVSGCAGNSSKTYSDQSINTTAGNPGTVKDNAGNEKTCPNKTVKIDKIAPTVPTNNLFKKRNATDVTSSYGLSDYTNNTWYSGYVFTYANGSTDSGGAGGVNYYYKTTGKVGSATDQSGSYKNLNTEGTSTVQYKACDNVGNCSAYSSVSTVKLDRTAPTCTSGYSAPSGYAGGWTNQDVTVQGTCAESGDVSGCVGNSTKQYTSNTNVTNANPGAVKDNAGNSANCGNQTVKIDKTAPTCTTTYTAPSGYNGDWTKDAVTLQGTCSDTGGSGCSGNKTSSYSSDTNSSLSPGSVSDGAGNSVTCPSKTVKIDKTGPTGLTVKLFKLKWILCQDKNCTPQQTEFVSGNNGESAGLETYTPGSWYNVGVHTEASGATDAGVGGPIKYYFTTTGKTTNVTDEERSWRNNDSEGDSTIKYKACDALNNCTESQTYTMRLDKTAPKATVQILSSGVCPNNSKNAGKKYCNWTLKGTGEDVTSNGVQSGVDSVAFFGYSCSHDAVSGNTVTNTCGCYDGWYKGKKFGQANFIVKDKAGNRNDIYDERIPTSRDTNLWNVRIGNGQSVTDLWADVEACN